jgi:lipoprotein signal peptidase
MTPSAQANLRSPSVWTRFLLTCAIGLAVDLSTKVWAFGALVDDVVWNGSRVEVYAKPPVVVIPKVLNFDAVANQGAVFGIGQGQRWLFITVSAGAIALLTYLLVQSGHKRSYQVVLGALLAGVLGNMYDRTVFGFVRDMIHVFPGQRWPEFVRNTLGFISYFKGQIFPWVFNVADMLLCVGVGISIVYSLFGQRAEQREKTGLVDATT